MPCPASCIAQVRVDQAQLETVLPAPGGTVLVVNGPLAGQRGTLANIDVDKFRAEVALQQVGHSCCTGGTL